VLRIRLRDRQSDEGATHSLFYGCCARVVTVSEESPLVLSTHGSQCSTHRLDQGHLAAGADFTERMA
jgi:hypothetical protein